MIELMNMSILQLKLSCHYVLSLNYVPEFKILCKININNEPVFK